MKFSIQNSKIKTDYGFTIIESLLYIAISSVIILGVSTFLSTILETRIKAEAIAEVEQQGQQIIQKIAQTIRNAEAITSPTPKNSSSSLTLDVVDPAKDPTIFDVSGGIIRITEGVGSAIDLNNPQVSASGVTFTNLTKGSTVGTMQVTFTLTYNNPSGRNEYNFSKSFQTSATLKQ